MISKISASIITALKLPFLLYIAYKYFNENENVSNY